MIKLVGVDDVDSMVTYASLLQKSDIIICNNSKVAEYNQKSASKRSNKAMFNLALIYSNGDGVLINKENAINY